MCSILDSKCSTNLRSVFQYFMEMCEFLMAYLHFWWQGHEFMWKYSFAGWIAVLCILEWKSYVPQNNWNLLKGTSSVNWGFKEEKSSVSKLIVQLDRLLFLSFGICLPSVVSTDICKRQSREICATTFKTFGSWKLLCDKWWYRVIFFTGTPVKS